MPIDDEGGFQPLRTPIISFSLELSLSLRLHSIKNWNWFFGGVGDRAIQYMKRDWGHFSPGGRYPQSWARRGRKGERKKDKEDSQGRGD